jgi:LAO/AO transport system kinase
MEAADQQLVEGVVARRPRALSRAITLVESTRRDHQTRAAAVLDALLPHTGRSLRLGISGAPGVGKSTFIEVLGLYLIGRGRRVAVLAVDPSSALSGGSILGDKTRMERLSREPDAFIRPSPSGGSLGGVAEKTREAMLVCEAAGFDVVLVETVGVGQSETAVAGMVDIFVLLLMPNTGDDLQAMKRGIMELADVVVVNKADLDPPAAERTRHLFGGALTVSAATGTGIEAFWVEVERFREVASASGEFEAKRRRQAIDWMWALIDAGLRARFRENPRVRHDLDAVSRAVAAGRTTAAAAAARLLEYLEPPQGNSKLEIRNPKEIQNPKTQ